MLSFLTWTVMWTGIYLEQFVHCASRIQMKRNRLLNAVNPLDTDSAQQIPWQSLFFMFGNKIKTTLCLHLGFILHLVSGKFSRQYMWSLFLNIFIVTGSGLCSFTLWTLRKSSRIDLSSAPQKKMSVCSHWTMRVQADEQKNKPNNFLMLLLF